MDQIRKKKQQNIALSQALHLPQNIIIMFLCFTHIVILKDQIICHKSMYLNILNLCGQVLLASKLLSDFFKGIHM